MSDQGTKFDSGKSRIDLISPVAMDYVGDVCAVGVQKYGEHNCEKGFKYSRLMAAALRHINAFQTCEDTDPETELPHLAHAIWNLARLIDQHYWKYGEDDRINRAKMILHPGE